MGNINQWRPVLRQSTIINLKRRAIWKQNRWLKRNKTKRNKKNETNNSKHIEIRRDNAWRYAWGAWRLKGTKGSVFFFLDCYLISWQCANQPARSKVNKIIVNNNCEPLSPLPPLFIIDPSWFQGSDYQSEWLTSIKKKSLLALVV